MKRSRKFIITALCALCVCFISCKEDSIVTSGIDVIFETDLGNDVDDAMAMDMLYKYADSGKINISGISINKNGTAPAELADILNTWYGYPNIPIAIVRDGAECESDAINYAKSVCDLKDEAGNPMFERSIEGYSNLPHSPAWYRKVLSSKEDKSVTIVSVGFSTNLYRLMQTGPDEISPLSGIQLIEKKVKSLVMMAGCFNNKDLCEYNVVKDIEAAKAVFESWPTEIITSPFEVGIMINYPATSIENDFEWAKKHPMVEAYKSYLKMPYDRPTWDLTSLLYAVEGDKWFTLSPYGNIVVKENGSTEFIENENGNRRYLMTNQQQAELILAHFIEIITSLPANIK